MDGKATRRLAWSVGASSVVVTLFALALEGLNRSITQIGTEQAISPPDVVIALTYSLVGALVVTRRPRNAVGWILCGSALFSAFTLFGQGYSTYALLARPGEVPGGIWAAWVATWSWIPSLGAAPLLFLLFPTGRLLSPRWRPLGWVTSVSIMGACVVAATLPFGLIAPQIPGDNPFELGIEPRFAVAVQVAFAIVLFGSLVCSIASVFVRYRRAAREERAQLKWLGFAAALLFACLALNLLLFAGSDTGLGAVLPSLGLAGVPVAFGVAILKYRLYDIDRIISRTLVYGVLTAFLGATYFVAVILLQAVLGERITDQPLAVAATTLAVAALFRPARARIQGVIDQRFNRRRYDAQLTAEAFSSRLRDEIDLNELSADLLAVVRDTVQPAHASLWLREAGDS